MSIENPFFVREARAHARKAWAPLSGLVLLAALSPGLWLWLGSRQGDTPDPDQQHFIRGGLLMAVAGCHALISSLAGWRLGTRVFGAEQHQNTLESLRLVAASSWKWVPQKLVFPLYALLLVWLAALPGCMLLVVRGHFLPATIWPGLLLAGAAGLLSFAAALTVPPERVGLPLTTERRLPLAQRLELSSPRLISAWLSWEILQLGYRWLENGASDQRPQFRQHLLFRMLPIRADQVLEGMLGLFLLYALTCAWAWANPASGKAQQLRTAVRLLTLAMGYLLVIGLTWIRSHWLWQTVLVGLPVVQSLRLFADGRKIRRGRRAGRKDNPRGVAEIAAIQECWDNPVLIRDLRVILRGGGLRRVLIGQTLAILGIGGAIAAAMGSQYTALGSYSYRLIAGALASAFGWGMFVAVMRAGVGASFQWQAERRMRTISQLLLTPLPGHDIVRGRWTAALLHGYATALPWIVSCLLLSVIAAEARGMEWVFCLGAWLISLSLLLSAGFAGGIREPSKWRNWWSPPGMAIGWFFAQPGVMIWSMGWSNAGRETLLAVVFVLSLVNTLSVPVLLAWAGRQVEAYRAHLAE